MKYFILNPTGNITALVESKTEIPDQPYTAMKIMQRHPEVEQVGFVRFADSEEDPIQADLRMAGGEFCGNAAMCTAALYYLYADSHYRKKPDVVRIHVSGSDEPVTVRLNLTADNCFQSEIIIKKAQKFEKLDFSFNDIRRQLPVVRLKGITHIIIDSESDFFYLLKEKRSAEMAVKEWCSSLSADGLGLMFLEEYASVWKLFPLVWIPGSGTVFWENSCASGSIAVGNYLSDKMNKSVTAELHEPGGLLTVKSDPETNTVLLSGNLILEGRFEIPDDF